MYHKGMHKKSHSHVELKLEINSISSLQLWWRLLNSSYLERRMTTVELKGLAG
jgi:hypothetical protein